MKLLPRVRTSQEKWPVEPTVASNQRSSERTPIDLTTDVTLMLTHPDGRITTHYVKPYNISSKGVGFLHDEPIPAGTFCRFHITFKGEKLRVTGGVARCDPAEGGRFNVGVSVALVELEGPGAGPDAAVVREGF
jgi:hypothetical protein